MAKSKLRVLSPDEAPPAPVLPRSLKEAVDRGERTLLVAIRAKVAAEIDAGVPAHALSSLMGQLLKVDKEIRLLDERAREEAEDVVVEDEAWDEEAL